MLYEVITDAQAVLALNKALLKLYYDIDNYTLPEGFLCAPAPGRADVITSYSIHYTKLYDDSREHVISPFYF